MHSFCSFLIPQENGRIRCIRYKTIRKYGRQKFIRMEEERTRFEEMVNLFSNLAECMYKILF